MFPIMLLFYYYNLFIKFAQYFFSAIFYLKLIHRQPVKLLVKVNGGRSRMADQQEKYEGDWKQMQVDDQWPLKLQDRGLLGGLKAQVVSFMKDWCLTPYLMLSKGYRQF